MSDEDDEVDIDVCQHCGRYFAWTPYLRELWIKHWHPGENDMQPQRCERCITGDAWIDEREESNG